MYQILSYHVFPPLLQGPGSAPVVKCLLEEAEELTVMDDHFSVPVSFQLYDNLSRDLHVTVMLCMLFQDGHVDQLQRPRHFPEPVTTYTIRELSITWHLYGGRDFPPASPSSPRLQCRLLSGARKKLAHVSPPWGRMKGTCPAGRKGSSKGREQERIDWKSAGGAGRDHAVLIEVEFSKVR